MKETFLFKILARRLTHNAEHILNLVLFFFLTVHMPYDLLQCFMPYRYIILKLIADSVDT